MFKFGLHHFSNEDCEKVNFVNWKWGVKGELMYKGTNG